MKPQTAKKLLQLNYDLYEHQAQSFSDTRKVIWEKEVLDFVSKIPPRSSVLDLGCGNSRLYQILSEKKIDHLGIDSSKNLIKKNKAEYEPRIFRVGDGLSIKFKHKFDYIICIAVLHHIPSEKLQLKFLKNIYTSLKPGGKSLISVWNRWQPRYKRYFISANPKSKILNPKQIQNSKQNKNHKSEMINLKSEININFQDLDKTDMIVPWKQSGYFRYIHAFRPAKLKTLAQKAEFKNIQSFASKHGKKTNLKNALNIYLMGEK